MNEKQMTYGSNLIGDAASARFFWLMFLGYSALDAAAYTENQQQVTVALPRNQWQVEVNSWFATSLSFMQRARISDVSTPSADLRQYWRNVSRNDTVSLDQCNSQKFKSSAYQSFSVLGLSINFAVGGVLLILGLCLTDIHPCFRNKKSAKLQAWMADGALQLQRVAYEGQNIGTWNRDVQIVPWTDPPESLDRPKVFREPGSEETVPKEEETTTAKAGVLHTVTDVRDSTSEHTATPENGAEIDENGAGAVAHGCWAISAISTSSRTEQNGDSAQEAHHLYPRGPAGP